jgi:hypothetical protein
LLGPGGEIPIGWIPTAKIGDELSEDVLERTRKRIDLGAYREGIAIGMARCGIWILAKDDDSGPLRTLGVVESLEDIPVAGDIAILFPWSCVFPVLIVIVFIVEVRPHPQEDFIGFIALKEGKIPPSADHE